MNGVLIRSPTPLARSIADRAPIVPDFANLPLPTRSGSSEVVLWQKLLYEFHLGKMTSHSLLRFSLLQGISMALQN